MKPFFTGLVVLLFFSLFFYGCAGVRPAIKPPPPAATVQNEEAEEHVEADAAETTVNKQESGEIDSEQGVEPEAEEVLNNDLELPSEALPVAALPVAPVPMIPNDGPAPRGKEPVSLSEGWRVQVLQAPAIETVNQVEAELEKITGEKTTIHWQNGRYVLVLGNFTEKKKAESLKEKMVLNGYEHAAVIKSPVIDEVPVDEAEAPEASTSVEETILYGWRIQVMSLNDRASARAELSRVKNLTGLKAYIEEVSGSFKIRVGNFANKDDALEAKKKVVEAGFEGVFPVETRIEKE